MLCKKPYKIKGNECACQKCMPCRFNTRRKKTTRILLEQQSHEKTSFVTLTYEDEFLPRLANGDPTLSIRDYQLFLKSLRRRLPPRSLRYYLVGEYGETTQRPHYHAALFGIGRDQAEIVQASWGKGFTHVGDLEKESAQYIAGYVTKKMTSPFDPRLNGRYPEFARSSNRGGGMGINAIKDIGEHLSKLWGEFGLPEDVPRELGKLPLDRYCRSKLRIFTGVSDGKTPETVLQRMREEKTGEDVHYAQQLSASDWQKYLKKKIETKRQKVLNYEYKLTLFNPKKGLL